MHERALYPAVRAFFEARGLRVAEGLVARRGRKHFEVDVVAFTVPVTRVEVAEVKVTTKGLARQLARRVTWCDRLWAALPEAEAARFASRADADTAWGVLAVDAVGVVRVVRDAPHVAGRERAVLESALWERGPARW